MRGKDSTQESTELTPLTRLAEDYLADLQARGRSLRTIDQYASDLRGLRGATVWSSAHTELPARGLPSSTTRK